LRIVELGRALCSQPSVVLLDEPSSGLDDRESDGLHQVLRFVARGGLTVVVIEHDLDLVRLVADVVNVMAAGRIIATGPVEEILGEATPGSHS
jgi:branched-chain amino acid transport system ATP-binding protein